MTPPITYWDYLQLQPLLDLQGGLGDDDPSEDELHFIVVHQVFELWFKLVLREIRLARDRMAANSVGERTIPHVVRHLRRVNEIFKLSVDAFSVLETLTPQDFLAFRKKLGESSGFQSYQMRQMEMLLGLQPTERERHHPMPDPIVRLTEMARQSPTGQHVLGVIRQTQSEQPLRETLLAWLARTPIQGSWPNAPDDTAILERFVEQYRDGVTRYDASLLPALDEYLSGEHSRARLGLLFIESYRELPLLAWPNLLIETVVELEELLVLWRTRHARMVERIIGRRPGTGGSSGVSYLDRTAQYRIFQEFWAVRSVLIPAEYRPALRGASLYELAEEFFPRGDQV